jgi:hypothetical protein
MEEHTANPNELPPEKPYVEQGTFRRENEFGIYDKQKQFLQEYLVDFNPRRACRITGTSYSTARKWMGMENFQKAIDAHLERRRQENEALVKTTLEELKSVMCSDIRDFVKWTKGNRITLTASKDLKSSKAIKGIEKTKAGVKLILHDKVEGIRLMMQGLGMVRRARSAIDVDPGEGNPEEGAGTSLLEALHRAHEERKALPLLTDGMIEVEGTQRGGRSADSATESSH